MARPDTWNDVDVLLLKKLWGAGFTASQIAARLGDGYTRNSVVGKVHRLDLASDRDLCALRIQNGGALGDRPNGSDSALRRRLQTKRSRPWTDDEDMRIVELSKQGLDAPRIALALGNSRTPTAIAVRLSAFNQLAARTPRPKSICPEPLPPDEAPDPSRPLKALRDLDAGECHWPIGDPKEPGFGFCAAPKVPGLPYCRAHVMRACETPEGGARLIRRAEVKVRKREMETA